MSKKRKSQPKDKRFKTIKYARTDNFAGDAPPPSYKKNITNFTKLYK